MDSEKKISTALVTTVKSADIGGLSKEYAEIALDSVLSEGVLHDIPVISTIVARWPKHQRPDLCQEAHSLS